MMLVLVIILVKLSSSAEVYKPFKVDYAIIVSIIVAQAKEDIYAPKTATPRTHAVGARDKPKK